MKMIIKNGSLEFKKLQVKTDYTWSEITALPYYRTGAALAKATGQISASTSYNNHAVSGYLPLGDAKSITFKGIDNKYLGMISFMNPEGAVVHFAIGTGDSTTINRVTTISEDVVAQARSLGATLFVVSFYLSLANGEIHLNM